MTRRQRELFVKIFAIVFIVGMVVSSLASFIFVLLG